MSTIKQGIAEFVAERTAMEQRIHAMITAELKAFRELTGASVDEVYVHMATLHRFTEKAERGVSSVRVSTPLD